MDNIFENQKVRNAYMKMYCESVEDETAAEGTETDGNNANSETETTGEHALISGDDDSPAVYIGTYAHYNNAGEDAYDGEGEASGWVDLTTFDSGDDFRSWLTEQADGKDVEYMFQDYQNFPEEFYGESHIDDRLWDYIDAIKQSGLEKNQVDAIIAETDFDEFLGKMDGIRVWSNCSTMGQVAQSMIAEDGKDSFSENNYQRAFDFERFGHDIDMDWSASDHDGMSAYESYGVDEDDDEKLGEAVVDEWGGVEALDPDEILRYVDYDTLASDLKYGSHFFYYDGDMIEIPEY